MKIIVKNSGNKTATYDLSTEKGRSSLKTYITRNANRHNKDSLKDLKGKLEPHKKDKFVKEELDRVNKALRVISKAPVIKIKTLKTEYNINNLTKFKTLKKTIESYAKNGKRKALRSIKKQIAAHLKEYKKNKRLLELKKLVADLLSELRSADNYQPYTQLLSAEFTLEERPESAKYKYVAGPMAPVNKYERDSAISTYLNRSVTMSKKTGQDTLEQLAAAFWIDFLKNKNGFFADDDDRERVIFYLIMVKSFFSHNASYYPAQGYGRSPLAECQNPLFYIRSQTKHHELAKYKKDQAETVSYGRQNDAYLTMIQSSSNRVVNDECKEAAGNINVDGTLKERKKGGRLGETLAHLASRSNNVEHFREFLENAYDASLENDNFTKLESYIPPSDENKALKLGALTRAIQATQKEFAKLKPAAVSMYPDVFLSLMKGRSQCAEAIVDATEDSLKNLKVTTAEDSGCIYIEMYPEKIEDALKNSKNIREGLTNLLIGFFGGLVNYNAQQRGLHYFIQRRQSFGFLRPTVTDVGSLRIRLSLGGDSEPFKKLLVDSIKQFDQLLGDYNFAEPTQSAKKERNDLVDAVQKTFESSQGEAVSDKTGTYCLNAMRTEDDQWIALPVAQKYLSENKGKRRLAFKDYLQKFVIDRVNHKRVADNDHKSIPRTGYTFVNSAEIAPDLSDDNDAPSIIQSHALFKLLHNLIETTLRYVQSLEGIQTSSSIYYVLVKLLHFCQKGRAILDHVEDYEISHLQAKATALIENIQEHLIPLRVLVGDLDTAVSALTKIERARFSNALDLDKKQLSVYYNDGGMQAINTAIMTMGFEGVKSFYISHACYYEVEKFCHDSGITINKVMSAEAWLCDVTQFSWFKDKLEEAKNLKAIVIDITNNSSSEKLREIKDFVHAAKKRGIHVVLSCSVLKNEQFGQDKFQAGRNVFITPDGKVLRRLSTKHLGAVSGEAINPLIAGFRQNIETVNNNKDCAKALLKHGLYKTAPDLMDETAINKPKTMTSK